MNLGQGGHLVDAKPSLAICLSKGAIFRCDTIHERFELRGVITFSVRHLN